ncbi:hypothetical protein [Variovorax sp. RA8]|uniref:hypothetical protein n=1 Tax=Variovorax sp. (strain JCM 16519 / RA8) TaxID=662548 RepID=UPI0013170F46|nr:hypothetical protein [Variovorax sp. RA8]VTU22675.1 hypothetical protein RA8CHR_02580 [Variovorax sp. RA8]
MITQLQSRASSTLSVSSVSASVSVTQTRTAVYAGFMLGSRLPAPHNPGYNAGFIAGFVAYRATVTMQVSIRASYRFSACSQARPQTKDPVRALFERTRELPAGAMLFAQTTTYRATTVSMLYFDYVCTQASAHARGARPRPMPAHTPRRLEPANAPAAPAAPPIKPVPQAANATAPAPVPASSAPASEPPGATVSLKPVEPSKTSDPFDWVKLPNKEIGHRYEVWNALGREKPARVKVSLKASPQEPKIFTPRTIDQKGLSFSAVNADGTPEEIAFGDVSRLEVLSV